MGAARDMGRISPSDRLRDGGIALNLTRKGQRVAGRIDAEASLSQTDTAAQLGALLKARRRAKRMTLRDLANEIDVSLNTLSRVERGYLPDLRNFQRIVDWLEVPAQMFLGSPGVEYSTPEVIARHLHSDERLTRDAAAKIARIVEEMYHNLVAERLRVAVHLRSAKTFTPAAGALLAEILTEMQSALLSASTD
jgi:transcriptional regulator with XRE-family HTH domain